MNVFFDTLILLLKQYNTKRSEIGQMRGADEGRLRHTKRSEMVQIRGRHTRPTEAYR